MYDRIAELKRILNEELDGELLESGVTLILHNEGKVILQFCGWSINLYSDGTWIWEDTTGG